MVQIIIGNIDSKIVGVMPDQVNQDLDKVLSYKHPDARYIPSVKARKWDGVFHLYKRSKGQSFHTGLLSLVREVLDRHKIGFTKIDRRVCPTPNMPELKFVPSSDYEERDYQSFTVDRAVRFTRGILGVCTGGGKTMTVIRMIGEIKTAPFIFYVLTKDLMRQAHAMLSECLNQPIGMIGDSCCDIQNITVCTIQTAIRSLNQGNPNFKISDYIFDDEDKWDEKGIESAEKSERIRDLIRNAKGVYFDECVSGDTKVITEKGEIRIDKIQENNCRFVQTYDGNNVVMKPILNWFKKGIRPTVKIQTNGGGVILCTKEHLIYTKRGWIEAGKLNQTDELLSVNADVEQSFRTINTDHSFQNLCDTNWCKIEKITDHARREVYDIEVEDTHCFFGNGLLMHNCHHASAKTCQDVLTASSNAFWRFAGSATPYREDGSDLLIQAMFGAKVVDINASYLIKRGFLVKPYIYFVPVDNQIDYRSWQKVYKYAVVENQPFNAKIANTANHMVSNGLSTLVLVQHYPQGDMLKTMIPGSEFITGKSTSKLRQESLKRLESKDLKCLIATSLADEGLDIPTLDTAILAGGGASSTRINQRIGRTIRRDKLKIKDKSIVIMYDHFNTRHLQKHTKKVRAILKKEEEFVVRDSKGFDFINGEIDKTLGIENISRTIFDS